MKIKTKLKASEILNYRGNTHNADGKLTVSAYEHAQAVQRRYTAPFGRSLRKMIEGWAEYAEAYQARFESLIGNDPVLGVLWTDQGKAMLGLLDGELGGFDAGSLSGNILDFAKVHGVDLFND